MSSNRTGSIYKVTCIANGHVYIGSTVKTPRRQRWLEHLHYLRHNKHVTRRLQNCFTKYGEQSLLWETVEDVDDQLLLLAREQFWIWRYPRAILMNTHPVSDATICANLSSKGRKDTPETIERKRIARNLAIYEGRANLREWTPERRLAHGIALAGRKMPSMTQSTKDKISDRAKGRRQTPEVIEKIKAARRLTTLARIPIWREMKDRGMSLRQIELSTGHSRKVIARELKL